MRHLKFDRVYHPFDKWEEVKFNMWGNVKDKKEYLARAIDFTANHAEYGFYMNRVVNEWPVSCENALTDYSINRKAWVGHAACALAFQCPEDIIRLAWSHLTDEQQLLANREAERAIQSWEYAYAKNIGIYQNMGKQMLFEWDS